jgi:hypothetical protein
VRLSADTHPISHLAVVGCALAEKMVHNGVLYISILADNTGCT